MKKVITCICAIAMLLCSVALPASAQGMDNGVVTVVATATGEIRYFADGSTIEVSQREVPSFRASGSKNGAKDYTFKDSSGNVEWIYTILASFTYNGSSATCTNVWDNVTIKEGNWKKYSASFSRSGNMGYSHFVMKRYMLGIPMQTVEDNASIGCNANGGLY